MRRCSKRSTPSWHNGNPFYFNPKKEMLLNILMLLAGLALILFGANYMTDGAASIARRYGISDLVIGLTIVAFGTSAPELAISVISAAQGQAELAVGNVVGSNIFNILMIVGCTALVCPLSVGSGTLSKEIPLVILSSLVLFFCGDDMLIDGESRNVLSRIDGLVLLAFFLIFLRYTFSIARDGTLSPGEGQEEKPPMRMLLAVVCVVGGLCGLILGGNWFVDGASGIARGLGVSESVIGLTLVAMGTSLPELATSIVAAVKHNPGIAIGNVVGSSLFNVFFILGVAATVSPLPMGNIGVTDLLVLTGASVLLLAAGALVGKRTITRGEGAVMVLCYIGYTVYLLLNA